MQVLDDHEDRLLLGQPKHQLEQRLERPLPLLGSHDGGDAGRGGKGQSQDSRSRRCSSSTTWSTRS